MRSAKRLGGKVSLKSFIQRRQTACAFATFAPRTKKRMSRVTSNPRFKPLQASNFALEIRYDPVNGFGFDGHG